MPIGSSNDFRDKSRLIQNDFLASSTQNPSEQLLDDTSGLEHKIPKQFRTKPGYHFHHQQQAKHNQMKNDKLFQNENEDSSSASILSKFTPYT